MKQLRFLFVFILVVFSVGIAQAVPIDIYSRDSFTTGDGALTALNGAGLKTGDIAYVKIQDDETYGDGLFIYFYVSDSAATVIAPNVYMPSAGTTDGRWIRVIPYIEPEDLKTMETGTNPTPSSVYNLTMDSNGAAGSDDRIIRAIDASNNQWPVGQRVVSIPINFTRPQVWPAARRDFWEVWENVTGMTYTITEIRCTADIETDIVFKTSTSISNSAISKTLGTVTTDTARSGGGYYKNVTSLTNYTILANEWLVVDFDDTDDPNGGHCTIKGVFNAAVN